MDSTPYCCHFISRIGNIYISLEELNEVYEYIQDNSEKFNGIFEDITSEEYQKKIKEKISHIAFNSIELLQDISAPCNKCIEEIQRLITAFMQLGMEVYTFYSHESTV